MDKVTMILPVYNSGEHLVPAVESILHNTEYPFKLIIVESQSNDGSEKTCDKYAMNFPEKVEVYHTKREGLIKAINFGISKADGDVYLTQDDVILPKLYKRDWLTILHDIAQESNCGMVTTMGGYGISGPDYIDGFKWVGTWSCYIPRRTIKKVGNFDEAFSPGCGDDIDYSFRVFLSGLRIYLAQFWVDHHRMTEHKNQDQFIIKSHAEYFRNKWKHVLQST